jgi:hypothetical protein
VRSEKRPGLRNSVLVLSLTAVGVGLAGCGSAASSASPDAGPPPNASLAPTCQRVADVLSDGPDPGVDPVGYALAQVLPLRGIKTSDIMLEKAIDELAAAYERVYKTHAAKGTGAAVTKAGAAVDKICPGATS